MNHLLDDLVETIRADGNVERVGVLSTGERCYVALATNRYDLLPANYADPIEAWYRLEPDLRASVASWRGWPSSYAGCRQ